MFLIVCCIILNFPIYPSLKILHPNRHDYIFHLKNAPEVYNNIILIFQENILKNLNGWVILKILISWNILSNFMKFFYHILVLLKVILEI
jgi:hypothetical protein